MSSLGDNEFFSILLVDASPRRSALPLPFLEDPHAPELLVSVLRQAVCRHVTHVVERLRDSLLEGRRHFLMGAGGAVLAVPALPSLFGPREARAGGLGVNRNFISYRITHGFYGQPW